MCILLFLMAFDKGDVNRPGTGSFNTRNQWDTKARQGSSPSHTASPTVRPGKRAAAPTSLFYGDNKAMDELVKRISEAKMRVYIKALFLHMYKLPLQEQWSGPDGVCTKIANNLFYSTQTMLKVITRLAAEDLGITVRASGSGGRSKKIRLSTAAEHKKKL